MCILGFSLVSHMQPYAGLLKYYLASSNALTKKTKAPHLLISPDAFYCSVLLDKRARRMVMKCLISL